MVTGYRNRSQEDEVDEGLEDLLVTMDPEQLNHWISLFFVETRKVTG